MKKSILCILMPIVAAMLICGCGSDPGKDLSDSSEEASATAIPTVTSLTVSCAGDCTLASDESFSDNTVEEVYEREKSTAYFFENVKSIFEDDDITIVNCEGTFSTRGERQDKEYAFRADPEMVNALKDGSVEAVTLANNHTMDYGTEAYEDTKSALDGAGIAWADKNNIAVLDVHGIKVAVVALYQLDHSAEERVESLMDEANEKADLIIAEIHWGVEKAEAPEDEQVELAHKAVDLGADLVIGHHPHVVQGIEKYNGRYICYSVGNFCFGGNPNPSDTDSMIFRQTFSFREGQLANDDSYEIIPCSISSVSSENDYRPTPLEGDEKTRVEEKISERTKLVNNGNLDLKFD